MYRTRDQSDDCIIEGDLPMLIPNSYVQETAERLSLYRRLADITNEDELQRFAAEVTDRFGPLPHEVNELMEAIRLRWLGQQMGLEKMIIKHGDLRGTFIADQKHAFFESGKFQGLLRTIQAHPKRYAMFERKGTLRISIAEVRTVAQAKKALEEALGG